MSLLLSCNQLLANVYFDEFKLRFATGAMRDRVDALQLVRFLGRAQSFESMAVLFYWADFGLDPKRLTRNERHFLGVPSLPNNESTPWIAADVPPFAVEMAKVTFQTWVQNSSSRYDLKISGGIASAWARDDVTEENLVDKLFAAHLLSNTPWGRWNFSSTTQMSVPSALMSYLRKPGLAQDLEIPANRFLQERLEEINENVLTALIRQLKQMSAHQRDGYWTELQTLAMQRQPFATLFEKVKRNFRSRKDLETQQEAKIYLILSSIRTKRDLEDLGKQRKLRDALSVLNDFWHDPGLRLFGELRRIHAERITRGYGDLSTLLDSQLELYAKAALDNLLEQEELVFEGDSRPNEQVGKAIKTCLAALLGGEATNP